MAHGKRGIEAIEQFQQTVKKCRTDETSQGLDCLAHAVGLREKHGCPAALPPANNANFADADAATSASSALYPTSTPPSPHVLPPISPKSHSHSPLPSILYFSSLSRCSNISSSSSRQLAALFLGFPKALFSVVPFSGYVYCNSIPILISCICHLCSPSRISHVTRLIPSISPRPYTRLYLFHIALQFPIASSVFALSIAHCFSPGEGRAAIVTAATLGTYTLVTRQQ
ncbi:hypothetical protein DL89DRAFT_158746 [Linderina pennispora]|uniref:Uncharacterized protein n=1 Tax=Linderina pennispora TaxID=61395 RepID=A0A1Y1VUB2_9FUNG|nr:uncharacterized protein DL89DRAFT_158746 [Linderina pennispora]ORX64773.1 hypothetical protein DL89DRAFT_158746 [Linderina pennispora]